MTYETYCTSSQFFTILKFYEPQTAQQRSHVFVIQDLFKILTKYKAIRCAFWVPLDLRYSKEEQKQNKKSWRQWYKNHKMPTLIKHLEFHGCISNTAGVWNSWASAQTGGGGGKCCKHKTFVQITAERHCSETDPYKKTININTSKLTKFTNVQVCLPELKHALWFDNTKKIPSISDWKINKSILKSETRIYKIILHQHA